LSEARHVAHHVRDRRIAERVLYRRADGKWTWHLLANGDIIATDGGQGYESLTDARLMVERIIGGYYEDAEERVVS
jgi:uncharacterized protein YegP (UPF0339 family)